MDKESIKKNVLKKVERIDRVYARPSPEEIIDMVFEELIGRQGLNEHCTNKIRQDK